MQDGRRCDDATVARAWDPRAVRVPAGAVRDADRPPVTGFPAPP